MLLGACSLRHEPTRQRRWLGRPPRGGTMQACAPFRGGLLHGLNAADKRGCPPASVQRAGRPHGPAVAHTARGNPQSEAYQVAPCNPCIDCTNASSCCLSAASYCCCLCCCCEDTCPCQGAFLPPAVPAPVLDTYRALSSRAAAAAPHARCTLDWPSVGGRKDREFQTGRFSNNIRSARSRAFAFRRA